LSRFRAIDATVPVILLTAWGSIELAVEGMKLGAADFITKPWSNARVLESIDTALRLVDAKRGSAATSRAELDERYDFSNIIGSDPSLLRVLDLVGRVAPTDASVLITGESGTGKELIAEALHRNSARRAKPFVKVNLGGISSTLFESEMFGHVRGAFTDARQDRKGRFEVAGGGTIFLDEIGELPAQLQSTLLGVLERRRFRRLGGKTDIAFDARVVSATHRDLRAEVNRGAFRLDLFYRLAVVVLEVPPLRERAEDIPDLARAFLLRASREGLPAKTIDATALERLKLHRWPGNVRELENLIRRICALYGEDLITARIVERELAEQPSASDGEPAEETLAQLVERKIAGYFAEEPDGLPAPGLYERVLDQLERPLFQLTLAATRGNQLRAAEVLGLNRNTLRKKIQDRGIEMARRRRRRASA